MQAAGEVNARPPIEEVKLSEVNEELRTLASLTITGELYIGNYELRAALLMETLMSDPILMKSFPTFFRDLDDGKLCANSRYSVDGSA